jgi:hypothetical protein
MMIYNALQSVTYRLNEYIKSRYRTNEDLVELSNILEQDGSLTLKETNKLIVSLINIERESVVNSLSRNYSPGAAGQRITSPPLSINLYIIFIALSSGKHYPNALKLLSSVVEFFQSNVIFDHHNTPQMSSALDKLTVEIINLDIQSLSQLWGALGCKYMPSVVYKVRMLTIDLQETKGEIPQVMQTENELLL